MGCSHEEVTDEALSSAWLQQLEPKALAVLSLVWARRTGLGSALIVRSGNLGHSRREPCVIRSSLVPGKSGPGLQQRLEETTNY
jgi:hypothetical protein